MVSASEGSGLWSLSVNSFSARATGARKQRVKLFAASAGEVAEWLKAAVC